ncbi:MAG: GNAT family N-acetyltransferase [Rhizobiaceae bacterium]|nr:GNAT family N-acetyltransferase [Rhizobiaceae bacterium]
MNGSIYDKESQRQALRQQGNDVPAGHLAVHRWYLRLAEPWKIADRDPPSEGLTIMRANNPSVAFYRFLYHTAGEEFVWGDRRRMSDEKLAGLIGKDDVHVMVLYKSGTPAGFYDVNFSDPSETEIKYFALLPGNIGQGFGGYLLTKAILYAGEKKVPLVLDTCTLDHPMALENYRKRGFEIYREDDEEYPDPRLDGTIRKDAGQHVPLAE